MPFPQYGFALWLAASLFLLSCAPEADTTWRQVPEAEAGGWGMNVWAPTPDEVFVVGGRPERGAIMRELDGSWAPLPVPDGVSMEEAAALPETIFTVWANVFDDARLKSGETLLVHGGTSGIGAAAIGLAKAFGAKVVATAGTKEKCDAARTLGADAAYNYKEDKWDDEITKAGGADVVLDMAGGDFVARNLSCMNFGGRHVSIAMLRGAEATVNIFTIMRNRLRLSGSTMKARPFAEKARLAADIRAKVWPHIESGRFRPRIDATFPLGDSAEAHRLMEAGGHVGKIVLKVR